MNNSERLQFNVVIPARYASTRLPGKPLLDIAGKPMVIWVAERAKLSGAAQVTVATDDLRIYNAVQDYGFDVTMTQAGHQSGTDRISEVVKSLQWSDDTIVVNAQGDEPLIDPSVIRQVASKLANDQSAVMSTACFPINNSKDFFNPNVVKVVLNENFQALYFSRAPIPYPRDEVTEGALREDYSLLAFRHVGLYAYRAGFLNKYAELSPAPFERIESLEQLRVLYHGYKIAVDVLHAQPPIGVDTQEDLEKVRNILLAT